jgi:hypothetical protein
MAAKSFIKEVCNHKKNKQTKNHETKHWSSFFLGGHSEITDS